MKIGWFTDTFTPQRNGVVTSLESFGKHLVRKGHEVHVFCPKSDRKEHLGMQIHSSRAVTFKPYPEFNIGIPPALLRKVPELDIVHCHGPFSMGWFGLRVARKQKIPKIATYHTLLSEYVHYLSKHNQKLFEKLAWKYGEMHYNRYNALITPSKAMKKTLREHKITIPINVLPTGIDTNYLKPYSMQHSRRKLGLKGKNIYLYLGRIGEEKSIDLIIKASKRFLDKDSTFVIAGRGPAESSLKAFTKNVRMQKQVKFVGFIKDEHKPLYYSAADAFITASTSETQGIVVIEALACGCPVIGADALAVPEFIDQGKTGVTFKANRAESLVDRVKKFKPTKTMRKNARKSAEKYSEKKMVKKLENIYSKLL